MLDNQHEYFGCPPQFKVVRPKMRTEVKYKFDHNHNLLTIFDSQKSGGQNLVGHCLKYDSSDSSQSVTVPVTVG